MPGLWCIYVEATKNIVRFSEDEKTANEEAVKFSDVALSRQFAIKYLIAPVSLVDALNYLLHGKDFL